MTEYIPVEHTEYAARPRQCRGEGGRDHSLTWITAQNGIKHYYCRWCHHTLEKHNNVWMTRYLIREWP